MKALNLKSMSWIMALAMMLIVSFSGCSDDNEGDGGITAPTFPELKETNCAANETTEISFEANLDWEISSNAGWCKFVNGEFTESKMSGKAGKQTIKIAVAADGLNYNDEAIAEITLKMGEKSQVIYKVKRAKKEYANLVVSDTEGNVYDKDHPLTIKGGRVSDYVNTVIKAEAEAGMKIGFTNPDWLTFKINEETGMYEFKFNNDNKSGLSPKYSIAQGTYFLTFATEDAETAKTDKIRKVEIPLIYEGLQVDAIGISPAYMNATVKPDGQSIISGETTYSELASTITARNDEFSIVEFTQTRSNEGIYEYDFSGNGKVNWVNTVVGTGNNKDKITVTVNPNEGDTEREAIIMVFPKAIYDKIKGDLKGNIIGNTGDIESRYNTNIMVTLKQEKKKQQAARISFKAQHTYSDGNIGNISDMTENDIPVIDMKGTSNVSSYNVENDNVWKISIPKDLATTFTDGAYGITKLMIEGVGMGDNQAVTEKASVTGVHGKTVNGQGYDSNWLPITITGWGIHFDNPSTYTGNYQLVVKGESNKILALCIIEIATK